MRLRNLGFSKRRIKQKLMLDVCDITIDTEDSDDTAVLIFNWHFAAQPYAQSLLRLQSAKFLCRRLASLYNAIILNEDFLQQCFLCSKEFGCVTPKNLRDFLS